MEREGVVQAREVFLRIEVRWICDYPPPTLIRSHIPHFEWIAHHDLSLYALDVTYDLVTSPTVDIVRNVLFGERVAINRVEVKKLWGIG